MKYNNMKHLCVAIILLLVTGQLFSQGMGRRGDRPGFDIDSIMKELNTVLELNDEQSEKIRDIYQTHFDEMEAYRKDNTLSRSEMITKAEEKREEATKQIGEVLTPEQFEKYKKWQDERRANRPRNMRR